MIVLKWGWSWYSFLAFPYWQWKSTSVEGLSHKSPLSLTIRIQKCRLEHLFFLFKVFKIEVKSSQRSWFVFRRYTDFTRLNDRVSQDKLFITKSLVSNSLHDITPLQMTPVWSNIIPTAFQFIIQWDTVMILLQLYACSMPSLHLLTCSCPNCKQ